MANPYYEVLDAVRSHLASPAISDLPTPEVRDLPFVLGSDAANLCLVCPAREGESIHRQVFKKGPAGKGGVWWKYPVVVLLISASNRSVTASSARSRLQLRHDVRQRLFVPTLPGVADLHDVDAAPRAVADVQAALGANYLVSGFRMEYVRAEERSA